MASQSSDGVPLKEIPGGYGLPIVGAIFDRFDFFVKEGRENFFRNRMEKYKSTVFRVNMPPGPPLFPDPRVIVLLDAKSFPVLFDMKKVEKKNVLAGAYMPSTDFTGGYRMLAYLDPSEEKHTSLKNFCFHVFRMNGPKWLPEFEKATGELWAELDKQMATTHTAVLNDAIEHMIVNFLFRTVTDRDPTAPGEASLGNESPSHIKKWLGLQLAPILSTGVLPKVLEELTIHAAPLPFWLVRKSYDKLYDFFWKYATRALDAAEEQYGLDRVEACHNLLFIICFNAYPGLLIFFPNLLRHIAVAGGQLQRDLAKEVRAAVKDNGSLNMRAVENMALVRSTVHEALRIDPPVPFQYGRAKEDLVVESHNARYAVKKGELLCGYQPFATRDAKVWENPEEFMPHRFMGEEGQKLLQNVFWSNGRETENSSTANKQCAGKDIVLIISPLLIAHLFLRYDSFDIDQTSTSKLNFTSLIKATH
eukprot:Gb_29591 [translate_table: standard]